MKIILLTMCAIMLSCSRRDDSLLHILSRPSEIVEVEKFTPPSFESIQYSLRAMGATHEDYLECISDFKKAKHDYFKMKYKSDGLIIESYIGLPKKINFQKKYPLIIDNRGGNRDFGKIDVCGLNFSDDLFKSIGESIIYASEVRGTSGSEGKDEFGGKEVNDIVTSYNILSQFSFVDQKNKFMFGWSRGSITSFLAMKKGLKFNAVMVVGSVPNLNSAKQIRMEPVFEELIPDYKNRKIDVLKERSVINWPELINAPLLIVHGKIDWRADIESVLELDQRLTALNKPHKLVVYSDSGHDIREHRTELKKEVYDWIKKYTVE